MPEPLLTFLKYVFLAILYLFFLRVLRAVWVELREPKTVEARPAGPPSPGAHSVVESVPAPQQLSPAAAGAPTTMVPAGGFAAGPRLVVLAADGAAGPAFAVNGETTVGRSPGCGVALPEDSFVSQIHARLYARDGTAWVEDLGSTNGTFVNGRRLDAPSPLRPGDRLRVGQTELELSP
jgi:hypothetical protein